MVKLSSFSLTFVFKLLPLFGLLVFRSKPMFQLKDLNKRNSTTPPLNSNPVLKWPNLCLNGLKHTDLHVSPLNCIFSKIHKFTV